MQVLDQAQRTQAIIPTQSFIVQAPAGSGKTELLAQRYLALLAQAVRHPEEIIAITFTRKAAAEMRQRILHALDYAQSHDRPDQEHKQITWDLAHAVLKRNQDLNWHLIENPNRLKITTIDAFCRSIVGQLPILSKMGSQTNIAENAERLYQQAAQATLEHLHPEDDWFESIQNLLISVDNDYERAQSLIIAMLRTREQWLDYIKIPASQAIGQLTQSLENIITHQLEQAYEALDSLAEFSELESLLLFASENLGLELTIDLTPLPENLACWGMLANLLITQDRKLRKQVTKAQGFPAETSGVDKLQKSLFKTMKQQMSVLLTTLETQLTIQQTLADILTLPDLNYYADESRQEKIFSLFQLLELAYAELKLIFQRCNQVDFNEIAICAHTALRNADNIEQINLVLDYKIRHILIDEFQDTSRLQFSLLESLTREWLPEDGRTVFLVGDPMQSIYRFRQAEVGLFLQVQSFSLNQLQIIPLTLSCNFRSEQKIIDWVNAQFSLAFPEYSDIASGAIHYSSSHPVKNQLQSNAVHWHCMPKTHNGNKQALQIVRLIADILQQQPDATIAILARKKKQLLPIINCLTACKLSFNAVDVESLAEKPIIHDLIALTCALNHLGDTLAWLSILRMPCVGLPLQDLLILANYLDKTTVLALLQKADFLQQLSLPAQQIIQRVLPVLTIAITERGRFKLRRWVEHTWLALGANHTIQSPSALAYVASFFELLENWPDELLDLYSLKSALQQRFANTTTLEANIHLMTIHKSKGLEFDYVILPDMQNKGQADSGDILAWHEQPSCLPTEYHHYDWLLAPKKAIGDETDKMYSYIQQINQEKSSYELTRLFYVAVTRAKQGLHLFYEYSLDTKIYPDSLLGTVWDSHKSITQASFIDYETTIAEITPDKQTKSMQHRLPANFSLPETTTLLSTSSQSSNADWHFDFSRDNEQHLGSAIHWLLKLLAENPQMQTTEAVQNLQARIPFYLDYLYIPDNLHESYSQEIIMCLTQMLADPKGRWILAAHNDSHAEYPISLVQQQQVQHYLIDRTFIDDQGVRWIIDYKTTLNTSLTTTAFLQQEWQKYQQQLVTYARFFATLGEKNIKLALYYPRQQLWYEQCYEVICTQEALCQSNSLIN